MTFANLIQRGPDHRRPLRVLIHSEPKVGKSHLAAGAGQVLVLDAEEGSKGFDVARVEVTCWRMVEDAVRFLAREDHNFSTVVLDTLDSLERALAAHVLKRYRNADSLADVPFGKGWAAVEEHWRQFVESLADLQRAKRINVIALAHSTAKTHNDPDGKSWKRWELRANAKTLGIWQGWVEEILFLRAEVDVHKGVGQGLRRVLHTQQSAQWIAGSRRIAASHVVVPVGPPEKAWRAVQRAYRESVPKVAPPPAPDPDPDHAIHDVPVVPPKEALSAAAKLIEGIDDESTDADW